jgi:vacuolar-type H+-ATPase subunit E/Vma4
VKTLGSTASVIAAMREDAAAELERIEGEAHGRIAALEAAPDGPAVAPGREERIAAALRAAREAAAREDLEDARAALLARERWFAQVTEAGRTLLDARPDRRAVLASLAREAFDALPPGPRTLHLSPCDVAFADETLLAGATLGEPVAIAGGCIARCGSVSADNSFEERARRLEEKVRSALGKLYAEAGR